MAASKPMSAPHFCTYFDHRYLPQGLALHASLQHHCPGSTLWVLCLSEQCETVLRTAGLPGMCLLPLAILEEHDPELAATRGNRSLVEYYFTCSPCLPRYLLQTHLDIDAITYLDADLNFYSSPDSIFEEMGDAQIGITPHRYPASKAQELLPYGRYNVGWLTFRRGDHAFACLDWWRERCIDWCHDYVEPDRFGDQKYLDRFAELFPSVHSIAHTGANLAPWNVNDAVVSLRGDTVCVDGVPVVFFHFQGLKEIRPSVYDTNLDDYGTRLTRELERYIYLPYLQRLQRAERDARAWGWGAPDSIHLRSRKAGFRRPMVALDNAITSLRATILGSIIRT